MRRLLIAVLPLGAVLAAVPAQAQISLPPGTNTYESCEDYIRRNAAQIAEDICLQTTGGGMFASIGCKVAGAALAESVNGWIQETCNPLPKEQAQTHQQTSSGNVVDAPAPKPKEKVTAKIFSDVPNSAVYLNDVKIGFTPSDVHKPLTQEVPAGYYMVKVESPYGGEQIALDCQNFFVCSIEAHVTEARFAEQRKREEAERLRKANFASVMVKAKGGANGMVYLNGDATGKQSPALLENLDPGLYKIGIMTNTHTGETTVKLKPKDALNLEIDASTVRKVRVKFLSRPDGGIYYYNGKKIGEAPFVVRIPAGDYEFQLKEPSSGQTRSVTAQLYQDGEVSAAMLCDLRVDTKPAGARVVVGGKDYGATPFRGRVPCGSAELRLTDDGGDVYYRTQANLTEAGTVISRAIAWERPGVRGRYAPGLMLENGVVLMDWANIGIDIPLFGSPLVSEIAAGIGYEFGSGEKVTSQSGPIERDGFSIYATYFFGLGFDIEFPNAAYDSAFIIKPHIGMRHFNRWWSYKLDGGGTSEDTYVSYEVIEYGLSLMSQAPDQIAWGFLFATASGEKEADVQYSTNYGETRHRQPHKFDVGYSRIVFVLNFY